MMGEGHIFNMLALQQWLSLFISILSPKIVHCIYKLSLLPARTEEECSTIELNYEQL